MEEKLTLKEINIHLNNQQKTKFTLRFFILSKMNYLSGIRNIVNIYWN